MTVMANNRYQTAPKTEKKAETHAKYIDIQYIDNGTEVIGFALANHRPGCNFGSGSRVRKVVVKIAADFLNGF
jgi:beta-galactosidase beta subunit